MNELTTVLCDQCEQPIEMIVGNNYGILCKECSTKNYCSVFHEYVTTNGLEHTING